MQNLYLGQVTTTHIQGGFFRLDGGAMFGLIPKVMWQKKFSPDEENRIQLCCNCLLIKTPDTLALIDTGFGTRLNERSRKQFGIEPDTTLADSLLECGARPEDIDIVILTHLHFDHMAGCLLEMDGTLIPAFPRAIHYIQRGEWRDAIDGRSPMKRSYRINDLRALESQVNINLLYGDSAITPNISTFITGGHTEWHQGVVITGKNKRVAFPGDLIPTRAHLRTHWNMAYDAFPLQTIERKNQFIQDSLDSGWTVAWGHDPTSPWNRLSAVEGEICAISP
ncbi:MAG: MBL fold metallo-hydrolase [Candidatus Latescibacterota bacterium]|nr:MBL fold metallo-hydrolase [Candidatus Latescibacterota bacterium]